MLKEPYIVSLFSFERRFERRKGAEETCLDYHPLAHPARFRCEGERAGFLGALDEHLLPMLYTPVMTSMNACSLLIKNP